MRFAWDFAKTKENQVKHGVLFEEAQTAFPDDGSRLDDQIIPALSNASYNSPRSGNQGSARFRNRKSSWQTGGGLQIGFRLWSHQERNEPILAAKHSYRLVLNLGTIGLTIEWSFATDEWL